MAQVSKATIQSSKIPGDLTDYVGYIDLANANAEFWSTVKSNTNTHSLDLEASSSQYASIADASQTGLDITGDISGEAWVKLEQLPSTLGASMQIFSKDDTSGSRSYTFYIDTNDKLVFLYFDSSSNLTRSISNSAVVVGGDVGNWVHVSFTADVSAQDIKMYKNGSTVADTNDFSAASSIRNGTDDFRIGARNVTGSIAEFFDGKIDDVRVWNDIRTADEIRGNMYKELEGTETNLQGYWKFNNNYLDSTSNGNDLTASGSPVFSTDYAFSTAGGDIRIYKSDGTTELAREVVSCDTSLETGEVHFKYTGTLSSTVDTEIQIHADGTSADYATTDTYGAEAVWTVAGDRLAMHFEDDVSDSSATNTPTNSGVTFTSAEMGKAGSWSTSTNSSHIDLTGQPVDTNWSITARVKPNGGGPLFSQGTSGAIYYKTLNLSSTNLITIWSDGRHNYSISNSGTYSSSIYHNVAVTYVGATDTFKLYYNGTEVASYSAVSSISTRTGEAVIGSFAYNNTTNQGFNGEIDELRVSTSALSSDWITTEYNNQNDPATFIILEAPGVSVESPTLAINTTFNAPTLILENPLEVNVPTLLINTTLNSPTLTYIDPIEINAPVLNITATLFSPTIKMPWSDVIKPSSGNWQDTNKPESDWRDIMKP